MLNSLLSFVIFIVAFVFCDGLVQIIPVDSSNQLFFYAISTCEIDSTIVYHGSQHILIGLKSDISVTSSLSCYDFLVRISFSVDDISDCTKSINQNIMRSKSSEESASLCEQISTCWFPRRTIFEGVMSSLQGVPNVGEYIFAKKLLGLILPNIVNGKESKDFSVRSRTSQLSESILGGRIQSIVNLIFGVSTPILTGSYLLPKEAINSTIPSCKFGAQYFNFEMINRYNGSVSTLNEMTKPELMHYVFGYFTDLYTMSQQLNQFPVDVHPGNQLYWKPSKGNMTFLWTDFGASSSGKSSSFANVTTMKHTSKMYSSAFKHFYRKVFSIATKLKWTSMQDLLWKLNHMHNSIPTSTNAVEHFKAVLDLVEEFMQTDPELLTSLAPRIHPAVGFFFNHLSDENKSLRADVKSLRAVVESQGAQIVEFNRKVDLLLAKIKSTSGRDSEL